MFNETKYTKWYHNIINNAQLKSNHIGYHEKHHIIPKCLGGDNSPQNLVLLTAKEHFIVHLLLIKMVENSLKYKLVYAAWQLGRSLRLKKERITSNQYTYLKEELSISKTGVKRAPFSLSARKNMSISHLGENNHMFGKTHSDETKMKISQTKKGKQCGSDNPFFGKTHSETTKQKIRDNNQKLKTCPHCGKIGKSNVMVRWHFANCKLNQ